MSIFIDYKTTVWQRMHFPENADRDFIKKLISDGKTPNEIHQIVTEKYNFHGVGNEITNEILDDTEEFVFPTKGHATLEMHDDEGEPSFVCSNIEGTEKVDALGVYYAPGARRTFVDPDEHYDIQREKNR